MEKSQLPSLAVVSVIGAFTCFLWLPLVPLILPFAVLAVALKWAGFAIFAKPETKEYSISRQRRSYSPTNPFSQSQAQNTKAWQSQASLPYPAGVDSLPFSPDSRLGRQEKSRRRQLRETRQIARVMKGLELRKPAVSY